MQTIQCFKCTHLRDRFGDFDLLDFLGVLDRDLRLLRLLGVGEF